MRIKHNYLTLPEILFQLLLFIVASSRLIVFPSFKSTSMGLERVPVPQADGLVLPSELATFGCSDRRM